MLPLFEMMMRAQNGAAMDAVAKQFNLAQEQATQAMAALMPAFSSGLKRNTGNPYDFSTLMQAAASGNYGKYFEDMTAAFSPQGISDGNSMLGQIFGSKEVSRAIAAQAAQMTGVGQDILKQMLPAMADMIMGGLMKQTTGQMGVGTNPFAAMPMAAMMQPWLEAAGLSPKPQPAPAASLFDNPFTQAMQTMFGGAKAPQPAAASNPFADNPFAKAFQDMMTGTFPSVQPTPAAAKDTSRTPPAADINGFSEMINAMFDSGLEVQKTYQKNMEAIFDASRAKPS